MYASVYAYPWDVQDETPAAFCQAIRENLGADTVSIAASYHAAKLILPHNPRRKVYYPDDGALYFQPDPVAWRDSPIVPHVGAATRETDPLAALCQEAAARRAWRDRLDRLPPQHTSRRALPAVRASQCLRRPRDHLSLPLTARRPRLRALPRRRSGAALPASRDPAGGRPPSCRSCMASTTRCSSCR